MISARDRARPYAALLLAVAFWGGAFPTSKLAVGVVPHEVAALLRFGLGAVVLVLLTLATRAGTGLRPRQIWLAAAAGMLGVFAYNALFFWGLSLAPSLDGGIIIPVLNPVLTVAALVATGRERAGPVRLLGLVLGVGGAVVFLLGVPGGPGGPTAPGGGGTRLLGDLVYLACAVCWAGYTLLGRSLLTGIGPLPATAVGMLAGSAALGLYALPALPETPWTDLPAWFWLDLAYLVLAPTAAAYVLYYRGVRDLGASTAALMMFCVPFFGAVVAFLLLGEGLTGVQSAGAATMLAGAALAVGGHRRAGAALSLPVRRRRPGPCS